MKRAVLWTLAVLLTVALTVLLPSTINKVASCVVLKKGTLRVTLKVAPAAEPPPPLTVTFGVDV